MAWLGAIVREQRHRLEQAHGGRERERGRGRGRGHCDIKMKRAGRIADALAAALSHVPAPPLQKS
jgi:hypothetical protein